MTTIRKK